MRLGWVVVISCAVLAAVLIVGVVPPLEPLPPEARILASRTEPMIRPGVSRDTIKIGLHAPLTGASPVPSDSVKKGKGLFFRWLESRGVDIHGRNVEVILRNDQFNPSTAVSVCKEMVEKEHVFMLIGFRGPDQMQACARYAASRDVPYVSPGSTRIVLKDLKNYFATTMPYRAEGRLMAEFFARVMGARNEKNGIVYYDSPNWSAGGDAFVRSMDKRGMGVDYERQVSRTAGASEARLVVEEMKLAGIENVLIITTPVWFLQVLHQSNTQQFHPHWTGISATQANDVIPQTACNNESSIDGARFFSPYPALADSNRYDPDFRDAAERFYPNSKPDDFMWQLWAFDRVIAKMLRRAGSNLTRDRFISRVERSEKIATGIGPALRYTPKDHFGARGTHVLKADCTDERWHTVRSFVHNF